MRYISIGAMYFYEGIILKITIPSHESFRSRKFKFWLWSRSSTSITPSTNDNERTAQEFESVVKIQGSQYDQRI